MRYTLKYSNKIINIYFLKEQIVYFDRKGETSYINFSHNFPIVDFKFINEGNNYGFFIEDSFCTQSETSIKIYNITDKSVFEEKGKFFIFAKDNKSIYFLESSNHSFKRLYSKDKKIEVLFSFQEEDFLLYPKFLVPSLGIGYSKGNFIKFFNLYKRDFLWQYDLETYFHQPAQIMEGRVLVSNNKIIFFAHTEDWSNYATFVLDAQTGQVLFTTQEMGMKLVEHNNLVYQIQRKTIKILDPKNLKIETIDVSAYCDEQSIFLDDHTVFFYEDKLYTLARGQGSDVYNIWVIFNLKTQQFEHREDMFINPKKKKDEKNKMFINDIQANDNLVAIRCFDNIYVFEKQDIESK